MSSAKGLRWKKWKEGVPNKVADIEEDGELELPRFIAWGDVGEPAHYGHVQTQLLLHQHGHPIQLHQRDQKNKRRMVNQSVK
jgi:hypothetical protein